MKMQHRKQFTTGLGQKFVALNTCIKKELSQSQYLILHFENVENIKLSPKLEGKK